MEISRKDLFDRVWGMPMIKLAKEFDISDVGLSKICRKHRIPTPPPGYWAKVAHGKAARRPVLPAGEDEMLTIDAQGHRQASHPNDVPPDELSDLQVPVATSVDALAPTAAATFSLLTKTKASEHGFVVCGSATVITCSLSAATVRRAVLVLDAIERALPAVGGRFAHDREKRCVVVDLGGERLGIGIAEVTTRTQTVAKHPKHSFLDRKTYQYHFSGNLRLTLDANYSGRKSWTDGSRARLEAKLSGFVAGLVTASRAIVRLRDEREAQRVRWETEAARLAVLEEARRKRQNFADQLSKEASAWRRFREIEDYVGHLRARVGEHTEPVPPVSQEWLELAVQVCAELDPSLRRLGVMREAPQTPTWYAPFGQPIVS